MYLRIKVFIYLLVFFQLSFAQKIVSFYSKDNVKIYAYDYHLSDTVPYVILLHGNFGSKLDYSDIAYKIVKLGYNCLAIDLRTGSNETSSEYKKNNPEPKLIDAKKDIEAAIEFIYNKTNLPIILFGTDFTASLAMIVAKNNDKVSTVVAFSPGEYFMPDFKVEDKLEGYNKKTFVACSQMEYTYVKQLLSKANKDKITIFKPGTSKGEHGIKALSKKSEGYKEYWLALYLFFKKL